MSVIRVLLPLVSWLNQDTLPYGCETHKGPGEDMECNGVAYNPNYNSLIHSTAQEQKSMQKYCSTLKFSWKEFHTKCLKMAV